MQGLMRKLFFTLSFIFVSASVVQAQYVDDPSIVINLPSRTLELYSGDHFLKQYSVAIGTPSTPTPSGTYKIYYKEKNPIWYPTDGRPPVESGPDNPLGYRWMEFAPTYGVHGTNSPWSIGNWASHGCVRMHERDVEDLFDLIPVGTPLKIAYERVKVRITDDGKALVGVYPDVYGQQSLSVQKVKDLLTNYSFASFITDEQIRQLIHTVPDKALVLARTYHIQVNQKLIGFEAIATGLNQQTFFVPVQAVAQYLNIPVQFKYDQEIAATAYGQASINIKNNEPYVKSSDLKSLFPVEVVTDKSEAIIQLRALLVTVNNQVVPLTVKKTDQGFALPVRDLAKILNKEVGGDLEHLQIGPKTLTPILIDGVPYILTDQISSYFEVFVYYNEVALTIEINSNS